MTRKTAWNIAIEQDRAAEAQANRRSREELSMTIKISSTVAERGNPPGKLADAELHFDAAPILSPRAVEALRAAGCDVPEIQDAMTSPLAGLKLIGFAIWERRTGGGRNVTFPARSYAINGERRTFALLRPMDGGSIEANNRIRDLILKAYAEYEKADEHNDRKPNRADYDLGGL